MQFTINFWNDCHYKNFEKICTHFRKQKETVEILEIGTFEGYTAFYLLDEIPHCRVTSIDPDVHEPNFSNNLREWLKNNDSARFNLKSDYSFRVMIDEITKGRQYDFIYIDGDHNACGVLEDAILAWRLLKIGGILLFDDYMMEIADPWFYIMHKEFLTDKRYGLMFHHPKEAIDAFLSIYKGQYEMYIDNYQIGVIKFVQIDKLNLNHGDNTQKAIYEKDERTSGRTE